uniref:Uncharacterized protein n=1 Tax=Pristionchus pacificus TaxID=54126 RepID=A0A2A6D0L5_PRIPA|eukprot:PDM83929.1 hypothetical protein PRIPAC_34121 [Pristionchus pacificus]
MLLPVVSSSLLLSEEEEIRAWESEDGLWEMGNGRRKGGKGEVTCSSVPTRQKARATTTTTTETSA